MPTSYPGRTWANGQAGGTPLSAANLNILDAAVRDVSRSVFREHVYHTKDWGMAGDGVQDDTNAYQDLIDLCADRAVAGLDISPIIILDPGVYNIGQINLLGHMAHVSEAWALGQGWRDKSVRFKPTGIPDGGYMFTSTEPDLGQFIMAGVASTGGGTRNGTTGVFGASNPPTGFMNIGQAHDLILTGNYIENWGREAVKIASGGNHRISYNFFSGLFDPGYLTEARGAFDIAGADSQLSHNEFSGSGQFLTSTNLYAAAAWIKCGASALTSNVYQVGDIGCRYSGIANRMVGERFDHNAGHGFYGQSGYDLTATSCHLNRNNRNGTTQSYDHLHVPSNGTFWMTWEAPMFGSFSAGGTQVRYNINDLRPDSTEFNNQYLDIKGDEVQVVRFENVVSRHSAVRFAKKKRINTLSGTANTLIRADGRNTQVRTNNAAANTLTVPSNASTTGGALPLEEPIEILQIGAGLTTLVEGAGVQINSLNGSLTSRGRWSKMTLTQTDPNIYWLDGVQ